MDSFTSSPVLTLNHCLKGTVLSFLELNEAVSIILELTLMSELSYSHLSVKYRIGILTYFHPAGNSSLQKCLISNNKV